MNVLGRKEWKNMNVLLVSPLPPPSGGMATWTEQYLKDSKNINTVYIVNTAFIGERALHRSGKMNIFSEIRRLVGILWGYCKILNSEKVDVIHINSSCSKAGIFRDALCVALGRKYPIVFHCHCNIQDQLRGNMANRIGKYIFDSVDYVLVLNKTSLSFIQQQSDVKVKMIPNAIDSKLIRSSFLVSNNLKNVIYVGHVKRKKGICEIIEAACKIKDVVFHLVGPVSDEIAALSIPPNVICYGRKDHEEVIEMMKKADVFLFPSYTEGFSMVMLEAMAVGLPIIASNVGSNEEMIESKGGVIISPMSSDEIIQAMESLRTKEIRAEMSAWNLNKVENAYRDDQVFNLLQEVYHEIGV